MQVDLSVIIVNYKASGFLKDALASVLNSDFDQGCEVIVVDNNSHDDGLPGIKRDFPQVKFVDLPVNRGFSGGANTGIRLAKGEAVLLLNPDAAIGADTIKKLYQKLMSGQAIGIVGPKIYYPDGRLQSKSLPKKTPTLSALFCEIFYLDRLFPSNRILNSYRIADFDYDKEREVEQVSGACLMVKKSVIENIGLLDENFFLYFEDSDLCLRARKKWFKIIYCPAASVTHHKGKSTSMLKRKSIVSYYRAQLYFFYKHYGKTKTLILYFIDLCGLINRILLAPLGILKFKSCDKIKQSWWALVFCLSPKNILSIIKNGAPDISNNTVV